jgi:hypothetical protein
MRGLGVFSSFETCVFRLGSILEVVKKGQFRGGNGAWILFARLALIKVWSNQNRNGSTLRSEVLERGGFHALV